MKDALFINDGRIKNSFGFPRTIRVRSKNGIVRRLVEFKDLF